MKESQKQRMLKYLEAGNSFTCLEGMNELGILNIKARVNELRNDGHNIITEMVDVTNRFNETCRVARYSIPKKKEEEPEELQYALCGKCLGTGEDQYLDRCKRCNGTGKVYRKERVV